MKDIGPLAEGYLQGVNSPEETRAFEDWLRESPENREWFCRYAGVDALLAGAGRQGQADEGVLRELRRHLGLDPNASPAPAPQPLRVREGGRAVWVRWAALAVAASVVAAVGVWLWNAERGTRSAEVMARVAAKVSGVRCQVSGGAWKELTVGEEIRGGTRIETGKDGALTLAWVDQPTTVQLDGNSTLDTRRSTLAFLARGRLTASVAKQAPAHPFVVETPHARATVLGTKFSVLVSEGTRDVPDRAMRSSPDTRNLKPETSPSTRLDVLEGLVELARRSDGKSVKVGAGQYGVAGSHVELEVKPLEVAKGPPTFVPVRGSPFDVGNGPIVALGDVNGDGHPDIVTANTKTNTFTILLGDGIGNFTESTNSPVSSGSTWQSGYLDAGRFSVRLADLDRDGDRDIASSGDAGVIVLLNNGSGRFTPAAGSPFSTGASSGQTVRNLFVADMNSDGRPDLVAATGVNGYYVSILLGDGRGGFSLAPGSPCAVHLGDGGGGEVAMGDFNDDGIPDFAQVYSVSWPTQPDVYILLGDGTGRFAPAPNSPIISGEPSTSLQVGAFNEDGCDDIVLARHDGEVGPEPRPGNRFRLLTSDGTNRFSLGYGPPCGYVQSMTAGDVNGDGEADVVIYGTYWQGEGVRVYPGSGSGSLSDGKGPNCFNTVAIGDVTGDGKPDLVVAHRLYQDKVPSAMANKVTVLQNTTAGSFAPLIEPPSMAGGLVGQPFTYTINASGTAPITFTASPLPAGLSLSGNVISGTPSQAGQTRVKLTAANNVATNESVLAVTVLSR